MKKKKQIQYNKIIVVFTEGETDEVFYNRLYQHLRKTHNNKAIRVFIKNVKGVGSYQNKVAAKFKHEIKHNRNYSSKQTVVFCSYDLDVFANSVQFKRNPPVNWEKVEQKLRQFGADEVFHIKADKMIEDWFLADMKGICKSLKITQPKKLVGRDAYEKMKVLFKKGHKVYQKGSNTDKFVDKLDIKKIYLTFEKQFEELKK
jgi:hypothetical protein